MNGQSAGKFLIMNINKLIQDYKRTKSLRRAAELNNIGRTKATRLLREAECQIQQSTIAQKKKLNEKYFSVMRDKQRS